MHSSKAIEGIQNLWLLSSLFSVPALSLSKVGCSLAADHWNCSSQVLSIKCIFTEVSLKSLIHQHTHLPCQKNPNPTKPTKNKRGNQSIFLLNLNSCGECCPQHPRPFPSDLYGIHRFPYIRISRLLDSFGSSARSGSLRGKAAVSKAPQQQDRSTVRAAGCLRRGRARVRPCPALAVAGSVSSRVRHWPCPCPAVAVSGAGRVRTCPWPSPAVSSRVARGWRGAVPPAPTGGRPARRRAAGSAPWRAAPWHGAPAVAERRSRAPPAFRTHRAWGWVSVAPCCWKTFRAAVRSTIRVPAKSWPATLLWKHCLQS